MKKEYSKPMAFVEDFSLQTSVAAGCEMQTPLPSKEDSCGYPGQGFVVFTDNVSVCAYKPQGGLYNGYCYHIPTEDKNLFNS